MAKKKGMVCCVKEYPILGIRDTEKDGLVVARVTWSEDACPLVAKGVPGYYLELLHVPEAALASPDSFEESGWVSHTRFFLEPADEPYNPRCKIVSKPYKRALTQMLRTLSQELRRFCSEHGVYLAD